MRVWVAKSLTSVKVPVKLVKAPIRFSTENARGLVRNVLDLYPIGGLRLPVLQRQILERFPDAKEKREFIPKHSPPKRPELSDSEHPIRYLKKVVISEMEEAGELHKIRVNRMAGSMYSVDYGVNYGGKQEVEIETEAESTRVEYRWRLIPGAQPMSLPDPALEEMLAAQSSPRAINGIPVRKRALRKEVGSRDKARQIGSFGRKLV